MKSTELCQVCEIFRKIEDLLTLATTRSRRRRIACLSRSICHGGGGLPPISSDPGIRVHNVVKTLTTAYWIRESEYRVGTCALCLCLGGDLHLSEWNRAGTLRWCSDVRPARWNMVGLSTVMWYAVCEGAPSRSLFTWTPSSSAVHLLSSVVDWIRTYGGQPDRSGNITYLAVRFMKV